MLRKLKVWKKKITCLKQDIEKIYNSYKSPNLLF